MHLTHCLVCGLWVSALLVQVALAGQTDDEECTTGCKAMNKPVCGADGITYLNKCLAKCQGVKVAFKGACTADAGPAILAALEDAQAASAMPPGLMDATSIGRVADAAATVALGFAKRDVRVITKQDMERFAAEDLVLVGVLKLDDDFKPVTPRLPPNFKSVKSKYTPEEARAAEIVMTADGLIYKYKSPVQLVAQAQATAASASSSEPTSVPPYDPNPLVVSAAASVDLEVPSVAEPADLETGPLASNSDSAETPRTTGNRKLKTVFGIDDRREITSKQSFPWRAVGLIRYKNDLGNWACSGSIIGPKAVITAAHCHLGSKGNVASTWTFYPNHLRTSGAVYGSATHIRIIANSNYWNQPEWWLWDMAIVIVNRAIGTELGYFGYQWSSAGYTGSLVTAGYPGDKPYGSFWYIGGGTACYVKDTNGNDALMTHQCDSRPGQSGSPYWIPNAHMLRAVESAENPSWNTACAINKYWYDFITTHRMRTS